MPVGGGGYGGSGSSAGETEITGAVTDPREEGGWGAPQPDEGGGEEEDEFIAGQIDYPGPSGGDFMAQVQQELRSIIGGWAKDAGYSRNAGQAFVNSYWPATAKHLGNNMGGTFQRLGASNMETFQVAVNLGLQYLGARMPFSAPDPDGGGSGSGRRGSRGGSGGPRGPTAAEIRANFDLEQLSGRANALSRAFLIQDHSNPRGLAKAYVDAIVANPDQKLDYDTFVQNQLKKDPRWNILFKNMPNGMDEQMYLGRYVQQALSTIGGGDMAGGSADQVAFEGAAIGAGQEAFGARLRRTRAHRSSSNYVNEMEDRMLAVSEVL